MNILKPRFIIMIVLLFLILLALVFLKIQSATKQGLQLPPEIQIFRYSPSPSIRPKAPIPTPPSHSPIPADQLTDQQKIQYQAEADEYYRKAREVIINNYPWYLKLPLKGTGYFIYFDPPSERFKVSLFPTNESSITVDEQIKLLRQIVIKEISTLGTDASNYNIDWEVTVK